MTHRARACVAFSRTRRSFPCHTFDSYTWFFFGLQYTVQIHLLMLVLIRTQMIQSSSLPCKVKGRRCILGKRIHQTLHRRGILSQGKSVYACLDKQYFQWILHDWSDEHCLKLLKNCWKALPDNGKVILMESILPEYPEPTPASQGMIHVDMIMLAQTPGGKERTEKVLNALAKEAGFSASKVICGYANSWVIEFYK